LPTILAIKNFLLLDSNGFFLVPTRWWTRYFELAEAIWTFRFAANLGKRRVHERIAMFASITKLGLGIRVDRIRHSMAWLERSHIPSFVLVLALLDFFGDRSAIMIRSHIDDGIQLRGQGANIDTARKNLLGGRLGRR
jgi:hypothetical protein